MKLLSVVCMPARRLTSLLRCQTGSSGIEFAVLLPLMLTLYISGYEISQAISVNRKVTLVAHTAADLVAQSSVPVAAADFSGFFILTNAVMTPYSTTPLTVIVSQLYVDANCNATVDWSQATPSTAAYSPGTTITATALLNELAQLVGGQNGQCPSPATYLIWGQASYAYAPALGYTITGTLNLSDQIFLSPRMGSCVVFTGSTDKLCPNES